MLSPPAQRLLARFTSRPRAAWVVTLYLAASLLPLGWFALVPSADFPAHVAIAKILWRLLHHDPTVAYRFILQPVPYYLAYVVLTPCVGLFGPHAGAAVALGRVVCGALCCRRQSPCRPGAAAGREPGAAAAGLWRPVLLGLHPHLCRHGMRPAVRCQPAALRRDLPGAPPGPGPAHGGPRKPVTRPAADPRRRFRVGLLSHGAAPPCADHAVGARCRHRDAAAVFCRLAASGARPPADPTFF